jgi:hypothetical protein
MYLENRLLSDSVQFVNFSIYHTISKVHADTQNQFRILQISVFVQHSTY